MSVTLTLSVYFDNEWPIAWPI